MTRRLAMAAAVASVVLVVSGCSQTPAEPSTQIPEGAFSATVTYVHDGDTLYLQEGTANETKVRLIGIDTPEVGEHAECWGEEATALLKSMVPEGTVVWALEDRDPFDRYGRALLYVFLDDATLVNLAMIEQGAAEAIRVGDNDLYYSSFTAAQRESRAQNLGMWGSCP